MVHYNGIPNILLSAGLDVSIQFGQLNGIVDLEFHSIKIIRWWSMFVHFCLLSLLLTHILCRPTLNSQFPISTTFKLKVHSFGRLKLLSHKKMWWYGVLISEKAKEKNTDQKSKRYFNESLSVLHKVFFW